MKKNILLLVTISLLWACGKSEKTVDQIIEEGSLPEIRAKKSELNSKQKEISDKIALLNEKIEKLDTAESRPLVTVEKLSDTVFKHYVEVQGDVKTDENIVIYPEYSGVLTKIYVEEGQQVNAGQTLAKIDDGGLSSQLAEAQTQLALAKTTYERQERLWNQQIGSEIQYLEAKTKYEAMQNSVNQLQAQLAKTVVKAPFKGTIDNVIADQGQLVSQGQNQLFRLINLRDMYVSADVPETYLGKINKGTEVIISLKSIEREYKGEVKQVTSFINPNNRSFEVKIAIPNADEAIKPNLIATVKLNDYSAQNALVIPQSILQENAKGESIAYYIEKKNDSVGVAKRAIVTTGKSYKDKIEITEGLNQGQIIILEGARTIREGQEVKIAQEDE